MKEAHWAPHQPEPEVEQARKGPCLLEVVKEAPEDQRLLKLKEELLKPEVEVDEAREVPR